MKDSVDYRYEILDKAGYAGLFENERDLPKTVVPSVNDYGENVVLIITGNNQRFEMNVREISVEGTSAGSENLQDSRGTGHSKRAPEDSTGVTVVDEYPSTTFKERMDQVLAEKQRAGIPKSHALVAEVRRQVANERGISL